MTCKDCFYFVKGYCNMYKKQVALTEWNTNKRCERGNVEITKTGGEYECK